MIIVVISDELLIFKNAHTLQPQSLALSFTESRSLNGRNITLHCARFIALRFNNNSNRFLNVHTADHTKTVEYSEAKFKIVN